MSHDSKTGRGRFWARNLAITLTTLAVPLFAAANGTQFGTPGNSGAPGYSGSQGSSVRDVTIVADGISQSFDLSGGNGGNGDNGQPGSSAYNCQQPMRPRLNIEGASGGHGGNGGDAGNGGNGADAVIFYKNKKDLKSILLKQVGGQPGAPGRGSQVYGAGCGCQEQSWQFNDCDWRLWKRARPTPPPGNPIPPGPNNPHPRPNNPNPNPNQPHPRPNNGHGNPGDFGSGPWIPANDVWNSQQRTQCSGDRNYDENYYRPRDMPSGADWNRFEYQWALAGYFPADVFTCQNGNYGTQGRDGYSASTGSYGSVTLVNADAIPQTTPTYSASLKMAIGKQIDLSRNIWVSKTGLKDLLAPYSDVLNSYTSFEGTDRLSVKIFWNIMQTPATLGLENETIRLQLDRDANNQPIVEFVLPNGLEGSVKTEYGQQWLRITKYTKP